MNSFLHIHPAVVHFPIALFVAALMFEAISLIGKRESFHQAAKYVFIFAALVTPVAVQTGLWELHKHQLHHPVAETHEHFAFYTLGVSLFTLTLLFFEKKVSAKLSRSIFLILLSIVVVLVLTTAYNGGRLVFEYGIGIE